MGNITDTEILDDFESYMRARRLAENTIRNRISIVRSMQRRAGKSLLDVELRDLRRHLGREQIAAASVRTEQTALLAFFRWAETDGLRDDNPALGLDHVETVKGEPRPFSAEQVDAMLACGAYRKTRAMILVGYYQGFRVSQIARVHGHDIDLQGMTIRTVGKKRKVRTLPLHPVIAELARSMPPDEWWFPARGARSGHVHGSSVTDLITKAKRRAGILDPTLTPHSLRHAFGTDLVEAGVDIRIIQELMMHESLATTQIYTRVSERRKREGIVSLPVRAIPEQSGRRAA